MRAERTCNFNPGSAAYLRGKDAAGDFRLVRVIERRADGRLLVNHGGIHCLVWPNGLIAIVQGSAA